MADYGREGNLYVNINICANKVFFLDLVDTRWRIWLRHCSTSRKIAGLIPNGVNGIFHWHNSSGRTLALESTQPPTEMSTKNICWGGVKAVEN